MKKLMFLCVLLFSVSSFADIKGITINSFIRIGGKEVVAPYLGEVCGHVQADERALVHITADPNSNNKGIYVTTTDDSGNWCAVVANYTGQVSASAHALHQQNSPDQGQPAPPNQKIGKPDHGHGGNNFTGVVNVKNLKAR